MPDLSLPIGRKIEKETTLTVPGSAAGELAVAVMCRVVELDYGCIEGTGVPVRAFVTYPSREPRPTVLTKQVVEWTGETGLHHSHAFADFSRRRLEEDDRDWRSYERDMKTWETTARNNPDEDDSPSPPFSLIHTVISNFPVGDEADLGSMDRISLSERGLEAHFGVLDEIGKRFDPLGHLEGPGSYGASALRRQTSTQFEAHVGWLVSLEA